MRSDKRKSMISYIKWRCPLRAARWTVKYPVRLQCSLDSFMYSYRTLLMYFYPNGTTSSLGKNSIILLSRLSYMRVVYIYMSHISCDLVLAIVLAIISLLSRILYLHICIYFQKWFLESRFYFKIYFQFKWSIFFVWQMLRGRISRWEAKSEIFELQQPSCDICESTGVIGIIKASRWFTRTTPAIVFTLEDRFPPAAI